MGVVTSHFLDSGSFTLKTVAKRYAKKNRCGEWDYYDTPEFWEYVDAYAAFVKKYKAGIDHYANVDVIGHPELTHRNQKYLEDKHGMGPVPVVHYGTDLKWLRRYVKNGYGFIALGGLVGKLKKAGAWLDDCFDFICNTPGRTPQVRVHGFGVTDYRFMLRYPWWSVDSSSWVMIGAYGGVLMPRTKNGAFTFTKPPMVITVSDESPKLKDGNTRHYRALAKEEKKTFLAWLDRISLPLGGGAVEGVSNNTYQRRAANVRFFVEMEKGLPPYPWPAPFTRKSQRGLGILC